MEELQKEYPKPATLAPRYEPGKSEGVYPDAAALFEIKTSLAMTNMAQGLIRPSTAELPVLRVEARSCLEHP